MSVHVETLIVSTLQGDVDTGGWTCNSGFLNDQALADYGRHAKVFHLPEGNNIWEADWLMGIDGSIIPKTVTWDRKQSATEIVISTSQMFLQNAGIQGIFFSEQPAPANPHQMTGLNLGKIVKHIVEEHTNCSIAAGGWVDTSGIDTVNSTTVNVYTVRESNSMWSTLKAIADNEFYVVYFTKDDKLLYTQHPMFAAVLPAVTLGIDNTMILGQPRVTYRDMMLPDQVKLYALTDEGTTLQSFYPANMGTEGRIHKISNIRCNTQARLDVLSFRLYNFLRRRYQCDITLPGSWGLLLELYDRVEVTYTGTASNGVAFVWGNKKFWVSKINISRMQGRTATTEFTLEEEFFGEDYFYV
jgi:hypothetical protein